jgi:hypothetical protein
MLKVEFLSRRSGSLRRLASIALVAGAVAVLAACSSASPTPSDHPSPTKASSVTGASELLKGDKAPSSDIGKYESALKALSAHCAEGISIYSLIDADGKVSKMNRLTMMQAVTSKIGVSTGIDCTTAFLDYSAGNPVVPSTPTPDAPQYLLGDAATTKSPAPDCSLAVANWTAVNGPVVVLVMGVSGPTTVTVTVTNKSGSVKTQTGNIIAGQSAHDFKFAEVEPAGVVRVLVTATTDDFGQGGSCVATGSPTS